MGAWPGIRSRHGVLALSLSLVGATMALSGTDSDALPFPEGFLWGTATAAYQVEGGNDDCDWYAWEHVPGRIARGDRCGRACDHRRLFREDFERARFLGTNAFRFSIEWSRIEPEPGRVDPREVDHYVRYVKAMKEAGLEPCATLLHFTLPAWALSLGGWRNPLVVKRFAAFARLMAERLGPWVDLWVTHNEPLVYVLAAYGVALFPPGRTDPLEALLAFGGRVQAHVAAYRAIHEADRVDGNGDGSAALVSVAKHLRAFQPGSSDNLLDLGGTLLAELAFNRLPLAAFLRGGLVPMGPGLRLLLRVMALFRVPGASALLAWATPAAERGFLDYVGVNYYSRDVVSADLVYHASRVGTEPKTPRSDMGWEIYPEGIHQVLVSLRPLGLPVHVLENGIADSRDANRAAFIVQHLYHVHRAIADGVPVRSYFVWSLVDNFEWHDGFGPRFGLFSVDYATQKRTLRPSGLVYRRLVRSNGLPGRVLKRWSSFRP